MCVVLNNLRCRIHKRLYIISRFCMLLMTAAFVYSFAIFNAHAQLVPEDLTTEQLQKFDNYMLENIERIRMPESQSQPDKIAVFNEKYSELCLKRAEAEYAAHGKWFYCEDKGEFGGGIRWDEVVTYRIYWQLFARYGSLEKIPNYSKQNHQKAIAFWREWQRDNGVFYNAITGRGTGADKNCNGKYVPAILKLLGAEPKHKASGHGASEINVQQMFKQVRGRQMNHGTAPLAALVQQVQEGQNDKIPAVEHVVELAVAQISQHTGMLNGRNNPGGGWAGYGATAESMKGYLRLIGYLGVENMPYRKQRADTLLENQAIMRGRGVSVTRNTAEMMIQSLLESSYKQDELLVALNEHSKLILSGKPWNSHISGDYAAYALMMFGPYLNWEGYEGRTPRTPWPLGMANDWRIVVGPYWRCASMIKRSPEEMMWHKDWSIEQYGLHARNAEHEKRQIQDIVPASTQGWVVGTDKEGRALRTKTFELPAGELHDLYVKIKWDSDIEIFVNDLLVAKKLGKMSDYGGVHIPESIRKTLKHGKNKLVIRTVEKSHQFTADAGLIAWRLLD